MRLKNGDYAGARSVADSALAVTPETTESNWDVIARLSGLTGKAARLAGALQFFWPEYAQTGDLHQTVRRAAGQALANAALGICDAAPVAVERRLVELIRIHAQPDRRGKLTEHVAGTILSFSVPCASGRDLGSVGGSEAMVRAQRAFAAGDSRRARAILDSMQLSRSDLRAADVSPMLTSREAALLLALGDTLGAAERMDGTLDGLPGMSATTLRYPLENAIVVRMMSVRADIAAATRDSARARQWSSAAAILWADADPVLKARVTAIQQRAR